MPYFVYQVKPFAQLEKLAEFAAFRDASAHAKAARAAQTDSTSRIRVMFANNEQLAEDLLCQIRDPAPAGDD
ncbi:hypothetical protein [Ideonella sp. A 288]|uniref:hypothetical protein n=1 Tax=Ideonella sp. A 288 TaxID=1962181 RepID=UPI000B4A5E99|nr:hypothetical protein [Ideonella sp. A 288]